MKIRAEFITNSSSASFVILKEKLTPIQIQMIYEHIEVGIAIAKNEGHIIYTDPWVISETENTIEGDTSMDNFDMMCFLYAIGIKESDIEYDHS